MRAAFRLLLLMLILLLPGCDLVGDIFEAGFWFAIIVIVVVVAAVAWLLSRFRR